jgi:hypothetical protein
MKLLVATRRSLLDAGADAGQALLLEGAWPADVRASDCWSLDESIDQRFTWIDREAADTAQRLCEQLPGNGNDLPNSISALAVNSLDLRYYLVKLLRVVAWFTGVRPLARNDTLELIAQRGRDEDYAELLAQLCRLPGTQFTVRLQEGPAPAAVIAKNGFLRRVGGLLLRAVEPGRRSSRHPRVVLCGNPQLLDPVCRELLGTGAAVWWLYDRFAFRSWLRWRWRGVGHLVCNSSRGRRSGLSADVPEQIPCRGVNLAGPLQRWLEQRLQQYGPRQTRLCQQIDGHFRRLRPDVLVLDEDATPLARIAVEAARRHRAASVVIQHGAPCCRFGFAPLAADRILVWGRSSRNQLMRWDVPGAQIAVTGSPRHDRLWHALQPLSLSRKRERAGVRASTEKGVAAQPPSPPAPLPKGAGSFVARHPRFLLLATIPPRDERPDAITLRLTGGSYAEVIQRAFAAVSRIAGSRLVVKLHPRAADDPVVRAAAARFADLPVKILAQGKLEKLLRRADCILSCGSSAGVDATLSGRPVIHLLPAGADEFLSEDAWGFAAVARTGAELERAINKILAAPPSAAFVPDPSVFGSFQQPALEQIVAQIVELARPQKSPALQACHGLRPCFPQSTTEYQTAGGTGGASGTPPSNKRVQS